MLYTPTEETSNPTHSRLNIIPKLIEANNAKTTYANLHSRAMYNRDFMRARRSCFIPFTVSVSFFMLSPRIDSTSYNLILTQLQMSVKLFIKYTMTKDASNAKTHPLGCVCVASEFRLLLTLISFYRCKRRNQHSSDLATLILQ